MEGSKWFMYYSNIHGRWWKIWTCLFRVLMWWICFLLHVSSICSSITNEPSTTSTNLETEWDWMLCLLNMAFDANRLSPSKDMVCRYVCLWTASETYDVRSWKSESILFVLHQRGCDLENCESTHDFVQLQLNKGIISLLLEALKLALRSFF